MKISVLSIMVVHIAAHAITDKSCQLRREKQFWSAAKIELSDAFLLILTINIYVSKVDPYIMLSDTFEAEENLSFNVIGRFINVTSVSTGRSTHTCWSSLHSNWHMSACGHFSVQDLQDICVELS